MTDQRRLTIADMVDRHGAAEILDCHVNTVDKLREDGVLTPYRLPAKQKVYFVRAQVEACNEPIPVQDAS